MCAKKDRISAARGYLDRHDIEALVFVGMANIRYLSGFSGSDGVVIITGDGGWFLTDSRYTTQAASEVQRLDVIEYRGKIEGLADLLGTRKVSRAGFDADQMSVAFHGSCVEKLPGIEFIPIGGELDDLRSIKDRDEIELLDLCATMASEALLETLDRIRPGVTEREIALDLEFAMRRRGADKTSFDFIVASGARGALPHGKASDKVIGRGELVTIDFGAIYSGYNSDETVTVAVGKPDPRQEEIYGIVKDAHDYALAAVRPGITFRELDARARNHIEGMGYGTYFGHGLGHGVGLEVHEKPVVSFRGEGEVAEGMVFTIEPGIYIPDWGGVRIEDTVLVETDGYRLLTKVPKELIVL
jgi:Xaa-Pro aminopeptidase